MKTPRLALLILLTCAKRFCFNAFFALACWHRGVRTGGNHAACRRIVQVTAKVW
jgi:hypothetical protein